jgi:drug/metabolite transporter (DMT)-like permease
VRQGRTTIVLSLQFNKHARERPDASMRGADAPQPLPEAEGEVLYYDRSFSTLKIADDGVRETSAMDFRLGPPIQRVVRAVQDFEAWRALPVFLLAGLCLTSLDTTAKYLVQGHALFLVVWARYAGQMLVVAPLAWHRAGPRFWRTERLPMQLLRSTMLLGATICFFAGMRYLPLAEGSAILFLAPILIVVLSGPVLGEKPTRARWIASVMGFVGVMILLRPGSAVFHPASLLLMAAALFNAFYNMLTRKLVDEDVYTTLFYSALVGTVVLTAFVPWGWEPISFTASDGGLFLLLGLLAGLGHWFVIAAYALAPASSLTPFTYAQMIWAVGYGYVIFGQLPDRWSVLGIVVIVTSGVFLAAMEHRRRRAR